MTILRQEDRDQLRQLEDALLVVRLDRNADLERVLREVRHVLGVEQAAVWGAVREADGYRLAFSFVSGWRPEPSRFAAAVAAEDLERIAEELRPRLPDRRQELRLLMSSTPSLMAWIGVFQKAPFTTRQAHMLKALTPAIERRVAAERALHAAFSADASVLAALSAIARPAYLLDAAGRVRHMNAAGKALADLAPGRLGAELVAATREHVPSLEITRIESSREPSFLVVVRETHADPAARLAKASAAWGLTRRQIDVLNRLILGEPNKLIAAHFGRAENTIELHVGRILKRAGVDNRAALVARFWTL